MLTVLVQAVVGWLVLLFGLLALAVTHHSGALRSPEQRTWALVGLGFTVAGLFRCAHGSAAVWAFLSGPGSPAWNVFLSWSPAGNYGGSFVMIAVGVALSAVVLDRMQKVEWRSAPITTFFLLAFLAGGILGRFGAPHDRVDYPVMALLISLELITFLVALFIGVVWRSMDKYLWLCLVVYGFREAFNTFLFSALAWIDMAGAWAPHPVEVQVYGALGYTLMIVIVSRRLILARRGVRVGSLFPPPPHRVRPSLL
ncbi:MAG: hypothetical protein M3483_01930 [Gemmatimonadota bacterium]|nr:hypothetical protein [Gemmatimonadota bacterium]